MDSARESDDRGARRWTRVALVLATIVLCVGCDQASKAVVRDRLPRTAVLASPGDVVRLQYAENPGAFLGLGDSLPPPWRSLVFTGGIAAFSIGLLVHLLFFSRASRVGLASLALVCGGGVGNLIDRLTHGGYVTDFLNVGIGSVRTGIFNVADLAITAGVLSLLLVGLRSAPACPTSPS
jgi:signal peptidase II